MREIKSITGLRVISVDEGANVGTVSQVVVDLASGAVLGIIIGSGAGQRGVAAQDIQTIGTDVIMISRREVARHLSELPELEKRKGSSTNLIPVFTNTGRRLGVVSSVFIDPLEKVVTRYEVSSGAIKDLAEGLLVLPIIPGTIHGEDAIILPDEAVREMGRETGGLFARFSQWGEGARKQYQQVAESAEKVVGEGAEVLKKEAAVLKKEASVVRERAKVVGEKATEMSARAKEAVTHLKEESAAPEDLVPAPPHEAAAEALAPTEESAPAEAPAPRAKKAASAETPRES
jgi:uncharacterized protein YrrD